MKTIVHGEHRIEISGASLTGKEEVRYDGKVMSSKYSLSGATHVFQVCEDGQDVVYEVELGARLFGHYTTVRRDGKLLYTDR